MRTRTLAGHLVAASIGILLMGAEVAVVSHTALGQRIVNDGPPPDPTACDHEAGLEPIPFRERQNFPKKVRDVRPTYPELPPGTRVSSGIWIGEVRLDVHGKVSKLSILRPAKVTPSFPAFDKAIADAVRQWRFEPFIFRGKARIFCMTVTVKVDPREAARGGAEVPKLRSAP
jgi:hypothetical protein